MPHGGAAAGGQNAHAGHSGKESAKAPQGKGGAHPASSPAAASVAKTPQSDTLKSDTLKSDALKIAQARVKGYEGDPCPSCGSFTLIRNGTCMKCDSCGGTTGCS
jgi:ribonucleoside-diphosphate reductase alpha chain